MILYRNDPLWRLLNPTTLACRLYVNRSLLRQFTWRQIQMRHKGSLFGFIWAFLNPLLLLGIYGFVFCFVFKSRFGDSPKETSADFAIAVFLGLSMAQLVTETLNCAPMLIIQNSNFVKKAVFPLELLPASAVGSALFHFLISMLLVIAATAIWGPAFQWQALLLPLIAAPLVLFALGAAWILSALGVFLRDMASVTQFLSVLIMFVSAVFYPISQIPAAFSFLRFNPLSIVVELSRNSLLWGRVPSWDKMAYLYALGCCVCMAGYASFSKMRMAFADAL